MSRIPIKPSVRFRILERDNFTCRYCGAQSPDVALEIDHIIPVSKGGSNDEENLCVACKNCNIGKGASRSYPPKTADEIDELTDYRCGEIRYVLEHRFGPLSENELLSAELHITEIVASEATGCLLLREIAWLCPDFRSWDALASMLVYEDMHYHFEEKAAS